MSAIITFEDVFKDKLFRIPDYQRGYSWGPEQLDQLWIDLENTFIHLNAFHFTGTLTVSAFEGADLEKLKRETPGYTIQDNLVCIKNKSYNAVHLIDGQQRLTTLLILLYILVERLGSEFNEKALAKSILVKYFRIVENREHKYLYGYEIDVPSHQYLIGHIFSDRKMKVTEPETSYTNNLFRAKEYFLKRTNTFNCKQTTDLIEKITKRLLFSVLNLSEVERNLDISMVFETLNYRGLGLSSLELFKNRLLYLVSKQHTVPNIIKQSREKINKCWSVVYEWLGKNKENELRDNEFLKAFWLVYFSENTMVHADFKAYQKSLFTDIFRLQNYNNDHLKINNLRHWLPLMAECVKLWFFIHNPYYFKDNRLHFEYRYSDTIQLYLEKINKFPNRSGRYMLNLILAVLVRDLPREDDASKSEDEKLQMLQKVENILKVIERHNVMNFLLMGNKTTYRQEDTFRDINYYYRTGAANGNKGLIDVLKVDRVRHFDWDVATKNIHKENRFYSWPGILYVLREMELRSRKKNANTSFSLNLVYPTDDFPKERKKYPDIEVLQKVNRLKYSYSLGNIYLSRTLRSSAGFFEITERIKGGVARNELISKSEEELLKYEKWGTDDVKKRGEKILKFMIDHWELPNTLTKAKREDFLIN